MPFLFLGALGGFFSVALGAFGAHALKSHFDEYQMGIYKTGVEYQFWHSLALLAVGILSKTSSSGFLRASGWAFFTGCILFSGSLYILSFTKVKLWGAVTPFGGVLFLVAWALLAVHFVKTN